MKKLVTLALVGVCALAFAAVADAGTVNRMKSDNVVKVQEKLVKESTVYANTATNTYSYQNGSWRIDYVFSDDITRSSVVFENLKNALNAPYSNLVPSIVGEQTTVGLKAYNYYSTGDVDGEVNVNADADWKSVTSVAKNVIPGRCARMDAAQETNGVDTEAIAEQDEEREDTYDEVVSSNNKQFVSALNTTTDFVWVNHDGVLVKEYTVTASVERTTIYSASQNKYVSPIVLDITGNGLQASNGQHLPNHPIVDNHVILADFYGDGFEIGMEWVGPQDGLLVAPKADGSVDMSCLFGTAGGYESGYEKLSLYDTNKDGVVNGEELNGLSIWQDANGNGVAEAGEVKTVQELGITELSLSEKDYVSSFKMNGKTNKMWDWWPNAIELVKVAAK